MSPSRAATTTCSAASPSTPRRGRGSSRPSMRRPLVAATTPWSATKHSLLSVEIAISEGDMALAQAAPRRMGAAHRRDHVRARGSGPRSTRSLIWLEAGRTAEAAALVGQEPRPLDHRAPVGPRGRGADRRAPGGSTREVEQLFRRLCEVAATQAYEPGERSRSCCRSIGVEGGAARRHGARAERPSGRAGGRGCRGCQCSDALLLAADGQHEAALVLYDSVLDASRARAARAVARVGVARRGSVPLRPRRSRRSR